MSEFIGYVGDAAAYATSRASAKYTGSAPSLSYLYLTGSASPIQRTMLMMGGLIAGDHPCFSPGGYAVFCHMLANNNDFKDRYVSIDSNTLCAGLITARWMYHTHQTPSMAAIRETVAACANLVRPNVRDYARQLRESLHHVRTSVIPAIGDNPGSLIVAGTSQYVSGVLQGVATYGPRFATLIEGGGIPWAKIYGNDQPLIAATTREMLSGFFTENFQENWANDWNSDQIISLCNFIARNNGDFLRPLLMRSIFICLAAICKGVNMTDQWVESRWETLKSQYQALATTGDRVTRGQVSGFAKIFIGNTPDLPAIYSSMLYIQSLASNLDIGGLRWIIEQSRGTNITGLSAIARAVVSFDVCTYTVLRQIVSREVFIQAATAMAYTISMPYGTLHGPYMPIARYADLAAIGIALTMDGKTDPLYQSVLKKCRAEQSKILAMIEQIKSCQTAGGAASVSVERIIAAYGVNAAPTMSPACHVYAYPNFGDPEVQPEEGQVPTRQQLSRIPTNTLLTMTNTLHTYSVAAMIQNKGDPDDKALYDICSAFLTAIEQTIVTNTRFFPTEAHVIEPAPLPDVVRNSLTRLGATPPQVVPIQLVHQEAIAEHEFKPFLVGPGAN